MTEVLRVEAAGLPIVHTAEHRAAALAMAEAVEKTVAILAQCWNLGVPPGCELRVLTDWSEFVDQTAPPSLRWLVNLTRPLWRGRAERAFALAGGWAIPWKGRPVVGVKPPEMLSLGGESLGDRLFVAVTDPVEKVRQLTCHELTHAFTAHLRLPPWLNEGLAMRAVDQMVGHPTVLEESRALAQSDPSVLDSRSYRRIRSSDHDEILSVYATGYWLTRQLDEESPSTLVGILDRRRPAREVTKIVMTALQRSGGDAANGVSAGS